MALHALTWHALIWHGTARFDLARFDLARFELAGFDLTWQGTLSFGVILVPGWLLDGNPGVEM